MRFVTWQTNYQRIFVYSGRLAGSRLSKHRGMRTHRPEMDYYRWDRHLSVSETSWVFCQALFGYHSSASSPTFDKSITSMLLLKQHFFTCQVESASFSMSRSTHQLGTHPQLPLPLLVASPPRYLMSLLIVLTTHYSLPLVVHFRRPASSSQMHLPESEKLPRYRQG